MNKKYMNRDTLTVGHIDLDLANALMTWNTMMPPIYLNNPTGSRGCMKEVLFKVSNKEIYEFEIKNCNSSFLSSHQQLDTRSRYNMGLGKRTSQNENVERRSPPER